MTKTVLLKKMALRHYPLLTHPLTIMALAIMLVAMLPFSLQELLWYQREAVREGQVWRLVTAHFVHLNAAHTLMNLAALALTGWLFGGLATHRYWWTVLLTSIAAVSAGCWWLSPQMAWYTGFSGALHGVMIAGALVRLPPPPLAWAMLLLVTGKLVIESLTGAPVSTEQLIGAPVATAAHLYGASGGLLGALAMHSRHLRSRTTS